MAAGKGVYVAVSGIDGCGKTTLADKIKRRLHAEGHPAVLTKEPGSALIDLDVRETILHSTSLNRATVELLLQADRAEHTARIQALMSQHPLSVVSDRCFVCGYAYGLANGLTRQHLDNLMAASLKATPDIVFYVHVGNDTAAERRSSRKETWYRRLNPFTKTSATREEKNGDDFYDNVIVEYMTFESPFLRKPLVELDGEASPEEVLEEAWGHIKTFLS